MRSIHVFLALALMLLLAAAVGADDARKKGGKGRKAGGTHGVITAVDIQAKTITVKTGGKKNPAGQSITVSVDDQTKFGVFNRETRKREDAKFSDVAAGRHAMIYVATKEGKSVASRVVLVEGKRKKAT